MGAELNRSKRKFILYQAAVFTAVFIVILLLIGLRAVNIILRDLATSLDQTTQMVVKQLERDNRLFPLTNIGANQIFIIDQNTGEFILERDESLIKQNPYWDTHKTKLIYEIQKQRKGWIYYPKVSPGDVQKKSFAIRYLPVSQMGWIVAVEGVQKNPWKLYLEFFDFSTLFVSTLILGLGLYGIYLLANREYASMRKIISDNLENSFISFESESVLGEKVVKSAPMNAEPKQQKKGSLSEFEETKKPNTNTGSIIEEDVLEAKISSSGPGYQPKHEQKVIKDNVEKIKKIQIEDRKTKEDDDKDEALEDLTIEVRGIKSPILKKMIQKIREDR